MVLLLGSGSMMEFVTMSEKLLKCSIFKGMFRDELAVKCTRKSGSPMSVFVPKDRVRGEVNQEGTVEVQVFRDGGAAWAVLPSTDRATIPVSESDLQ